MSNIYNKKTNKDSVSKILDIKDRDIALLEKIEEGIRNNSNKKTLLSLFMRSDYRGDYVLNLPLLIITIAGLLVFFTFFIISFGATKDNKKSSTKDNESAEITNKFILNELDAKYNSSATDSNYNPNYYYGSQNDSFSNSTTTNNNKISTNNIPIKNNYFKSTTGKIRVKDNSNKIKITEYEPIPLFAEIGTTEIDNTSKPYNSANTSFVFKSVPGQKIKVKMEFTKSTALNTPVIAYPYNDFTVPKDSKFFGQISGEYEGSIVLIFNKLFIPPDQVIDIKAIATDDNYPSVKGDYVGDIDVNSSINSGIRSGVSSILPSSSDFIGSLLSSAGSSIINSLDTTTDSRKVYEIPKGTLLTIVFLP